MLLVAASCAALLGSISGRVTDAETGAPIAAARIAIAGPGTSIAPAAVVTDGDGRFRSDGLAPGRYELSAAARGYVTASGTWRESITVGAGVTNHEVVFQLHRGAVVAGFIADEEGEPLANLTVELIPAPESGARLIRLNAVQTAVTDDRGYYRFWGLRTGRYLVAARPSVAELAAGRAEASPAASFYPGVQTASQAEPVTVRPAAEVDSINFSTRSGRLSRLMIRVVDANGQASPDASVSVTQGGGASLRAQGAFPTGAPGSFVLPQVPPGDYSILAIAGRSGPAVSYAAQPLTISGDGAEVSVALTTTPAAHVSGRIVAAKDASARPPGAIVVSSEASGDEEPRFVPAPGGADPFSGAVRGDGRFSTAVLPGRRTIQVNGLPAGWAVLSITVDGRDLIDRSITFSSGDTLTNMRIVITDRLGSVTGTVADAAGATALLFTVDRTQWTPGTRAILQATADQNGQFRIGGVRPGEYFAIAFPREWSDQLRDPAVLETLAKTAVTLTVRAGDSPPIALTVIR